MDGKALVDLCPSLAAPRISGISSAGGPIFPASSLFPRAR